MLNHSLVTMIRKVLKWHLIHLSPVGSLSLWLMRPLWSLKKKGCRSILLPWTRWTLLSPSRVFWWTWKISERPVVKELICFMFMMMLLSWLYRNTTILTDWYWVKCKFYHLWSKPWRSNWKSRIMSGRRTHGKSQSPWCLCWMIYLKPRKMGPSRKRRDQRSRRQRIKNPDCPSRPWGAPWMSERWNRLQTWHLPGVVGCLDKIRHSHDHQPWNLFTINTEIFSATLKSVQVWGGIKLKLDIVMIMNPEILSITIFFGNLPYLCHTEWGWIAHQPVGPKWWCPSGQSCACWET